MKLWECVVCGKRFEQEQSHVCRGKEVTFADAVRKGEDISTPAGRISAGRAARDKRKAEVGELENARYMIRVLRKKIADHEKQDRVVKSIATMLGRENVPPQETLERDVSALKVRMKLGEEELEKARADVGGLQLELEAARVCKEKDNEFLIQERVEAKMNLAGARDVWKKFIADCAALLGLPKLTDCVEYGGGAIRHGIESLTKKLDDAELTALGVVEGAEAWECDCKDAQAMVQHFRNALEKINEVRNDMVGRQNICWSKHIYPLVTALKEAGFEGLPYPKARARLEATIKAAQEMAGEAWGQEATKDTVMDVHLAEEFAKILFPFLEALEFYGLRGNWQGMKEGFEESVCDRDIGGRARAVLGRPDRDVPEDSEEGDKDGEGD